MFWGLIIIPLPFHVVLYCIVYHYPGLGTETAENCVWASQSADGLPVSHVGVTVHISSPSGLPTFQNTLLSLLSYYNNCEVEKQQYNELLVRVVYGAKFHLRNKFSKGPARYEGRFCDEGSRYDIELKVFFDYCYVVA